MGYSVDWTKQKVTVVYSGHCTETDVLNVVVALQSDVRFDSTHQALHDFSQCLSLAPSPEHLEEVAMRNVGAAMSNPRLRIAVVTTKPDVLAMLERFESIGLSPYPLYVFDDVQSANDWLSSGA
jgi:hypothetical protein